MKVSVLSEDNMVVVDGVSREVTGLESETFCALHWDGAVGRVEKQGDESLIEEVFSDEGRVTPYVDMWGKVDSPKTVSPDVRAAELRNARNFALAESDWTQLSDVPLDEDARKIWQVYRQTLRDVPQQENFPEKCDWPDAPTTFKMENE